MGDVVGRHPVALLKDVKMSIVRRKGGFNKRQGFSVL